ncbi:hypothetical protein NR798_09475 [Archangium gephyra]|uniref:PKD domain-containing protein n=1 Tax=Archangium gephyra TaxID=48 RepID=UPI0035D414ED
MSHSNGSRRAALAVALLTMGLLSACGGDSRSASAELMVMVPQGLSGADVARVQVEVSGPGITSPLVAELTRGTSSWTGVISGIPAGAERLFRASAYDATSKLLYLGESGPLPVEPGRTASVAILLQQVTPQVPFENEAPRIDSVAVSSIVVEPGASVTLTASAHDANPGDTLRFNWSATAGTFSTPGSAVTTWTAPSTEGAQRIQVEVVDSRGASATMSIDIGVYLPGSTGSVTVDASINTWPTITAMNGVPSVLVRGEGSRLTATVTDFDGDVPYFFWASSCPGRFDDPTRPSPVFTLEAPSSTSRCAFMLNVTDGRGGHHEGTLILHSGTALPGGSPVIDSTWMSTPEASAGGLVAVGVSAHDPDGSALRFSWSASQGDFFGAPREDALSSEVDWRAPACLRGPVILTATVTDASGASASQSFSLSPAPGSECTPATVTGVRNSLRVQPDGSVIPAPFGLTGVTLGAWVPTPDGLSYSWRAGTGHDYGTFVIPEVEGSSYLLRYSNTYIWTNKRSLDLDQVELGQRAVPVFGPAEAQLEMQFDGLSPWRAMDDLQFHSETAGLGYISTFGCLVSGFPLPLEGTTGILGSTHYANFLSQCGNSAYWLQPDDNLYVTQLASRPDPLTGVEVQEARRSVLFSRPTGPENTPEGNIRLRGTLAPLPTSTESMTIRASEFESLSRASHPTATVSEVSFGLSTLLAYDKFGGYAGSPDVATAYGMSPGRGDILPVFEFGNPYPRSWPLFSAVQVGAKVRYTLDLPTGGTSAPYTHNAYSSAREPFVPGSHPTFVPKMGPARDLRLNGLDATGKLAGVGSTPLLSWTVPALGTPTYYQLRLYRLTLRSDGFLSRSSVANLYTAETQLRLPPGLLTAGQNYFIQVNAYLRPGADPSNPFKDSPVSHYAPALTGVFSP